MRQGDLEGSSTKPYVTAEAKLCIQARYILRLCFIALACQLIAHYNFIYGVFYRSEEPSTFYRALPLIPPVLGLLLSPFFILRNLLYPSPYRRLLFYLFIPVTILALVNGLIYAREQYYYFGDLIRYALPWLVLFSAAPAASILQYYLGPEALRPYLRCLAYFAAIDALVTILFGALGFGNKISTYLFIYLVPWSVYLATSHRRSLFGSASLSLLLSLGAMIASSKRSNFALFFIAILVSLAITLPKARIRKLKPLAFSLALLTVLLLISPSDSLRTQIKELPSLLEKRAAQVTGILTGAKQDNSWNYRENEVRNVRLFFAKADSFFLTLTGVGFGGEIPMVYFAGNVTPSGNLHHVHRGLWLYYLRHGLLGVALLTYLATLVLGGGFLRLRRAEPELMLLWSFVLIRSISAYSSNIMMETIDIPLAAALLLSKFDRGVREKTISVTEPTYLEQYLEVEHPQIRVSGG